MAKVKYGSVSIYLSSAVIFFGATIVWWADSLNNSAMVRHNGRYLLIGMGITLGYIGIGYVILSKIKQPLLPMVILTTVAGVLFANYVIILL